MPGVLPVAELDLADAATAGQVHAVAQRAYRVEAGLIGFDGIPALHETVAETAALGLRWLGHRREGVVTGFLGWSPPDRAAGEQGPDIDRLCVDPAWSRRGIARALLAALMERTTGPVTVATGAANGPALALYHQAGFLRTGTECPEPGLLLATLRLPRPEMSPAPPPMRR